MTRSALAALVLVGLVASACRDHPVRPADPALAAAAPAPLAHATAGTRDGLVRFLTFLPPLVQPTGDFRLDRSLLPELAVEVCELSDGGCGPVVARLTSEGHASERLRLEDDHYHADWHTRNSDLRVNQLYRIRVLLAGEAVGHQDVRAGRGGGKGMAGGGEPAVQIGRTLPLRFRVSMGRLGGDPEAPAAGAIPDLEFVARAEDYADDSPELPGLFLSYNTVLLVLVAETTVQQANEILRELDAEVVGGMRGASEAPGILFLRLPTATHEEMEAPLAKLRANPWVRHVVQDVLLAQDALPKPNSGQPPDPVEWTWDSTPQGGNWGLELSRVPQMWNLKEAVEKASDAGILTGVLDYGFATTHPDLDYHSRESPEAWTHGTHIAGIIGAKFDNGVGVDGVNPFAKIVARGIGPAPPTGGQVGIPVFGSVAQHVVQGFFNLVRTHPDLRVVTISLGMRWKTTGIDPSSTPAAQGIAASHGSILISMLDLVTYWVGRTPLVVKSAGNDRLRAGWNDPFSFVALLHNRPGIIVVEAVEQDAAAAGGARLHSLSNTGGHVSAPGAGILSTILAPELYGYSDGTSMAAPFVAGVAGYLLSLDPSLTHEEIKQLLTTYTVAVGGGASPRVDAFASVIGIDVLRGNDRVLRMLVDVDDGSADGNRRVNPDGSENRDENADGDGGIGDRAVDMADFRRFRDWLLQVENPAGLALDGAANHPKKDVDGDGQFGAPAEENVYPRADFNGDGRLSRTAGVKMPGFPAPVTDLEVLRSLFLDPYYRAEDLPNLLNSADLEVDAAACLKEADVKQVRVTLRPQGTNAPVQTRTFDAADPVQVFTAPVDQRGYTARLEALDAGGKVLAEDEKDFPLALGSDAFWTPHCDKRIGFILIQEHFRAYALNNTGTVVGHNPWGTAFRWTEAGGFERFSFRPGGPSRAWDVNDAGLVVGDWGLDGYKLENGTSTRVNIIGGARGINAAGDIVGNCCSPYGAFLLTGTDKQFLSGMHGASAVNDARQVAGFQYAFRGGPTHAAVWSNGATEVIGPAGSHALDINRDGVVVGEADFRAVVWTKTAEGWQMEDLGRGAARAINDHGEVAGTLAGAGAVVWRKPPGQDAWEVTVLGPGAAYDINNAGQVVGSGSGEPCGVLFCAVLWNTRGGTSPPTTSLTATRAAMQTNQAGARREP